MCIKIMQIKIKSLKHIQMKKKSNKKRNSCIKNILLHFQQEFNK